MFDQLRKSEFKVIEGRPWRKCLHYEVFLSTYLAGRGLLSPIPALEEDCSVTHSLLFEPPTTSDEPQSFRLHRLSEG